MLKAATGDTSDIKWNFGTYFLIGKSGSVERLTGLKTMPSAFADQIIGALGV